jgi:uncharacterized protein involved in exopolysaccharide biosynthesis
MVPSRPLSPAERCISTIWANRAWFATLITLSIGVAAAITAVQPTLYRSQALLSVRAPGERVAENVRAHRPVLGPDGHIYDENDPDRQSGPGRYAPRLVAPGFVTSAAHDAGVLPGDQSLDDRQAAAWVTAERIEGADLIRLSVWQPAPDAAQKLAAAIVARGLEMNRRQEAEMPATELQRIMTVVDAPTRPSAPAYPRWPLNLAVGFAFGVLIASAVAAVRGS